MHFILSFFKFRLISSFSCLLVLSHVIDDCHIYSRLYFFAFDFFFFLFVMLYYLFFFTQFIFTFLLFLLCAFFFFALPLSSLCCFFLAPVQFVIGKKGTADGDFDNPFDVACSRDGLLYATDSDNHRLQVLRADDGAFVRKFGTRGSGQGQFSSPCGVCLDDDKGLVYVADRHNHRVQVHRQDTLAFVRTILVAVGQGGQASRPQGVSCGANDLLYVANFYSHVVEVFERENGTHVNTIGLSGTHGSGNGLFYGPAGVCCTADGLLYVADYFNCRVQVFRQNTHAYVRQFGSHGTGDGQFRYPTGVCLGSDGLVYVTDQYNNRVQVFRHDNGMFVAVLGGGAAGHGARVRKLSKPKGICCSEDGVLYVADYGYDRIHAFPVVQQQQQRE